MAWTQTDVDTLQAAIASGVLVVHYDGPPARRIQYQTTSDMLKALAVMQQEVARSLSGKSAFVFAGTRKGL